MIESEKEKTRIEWFETFPEPYKSQAINNFKKPRPDGYSGKYPTAHEALGWGFVWDDTPEGGDYWYEFHLKLRGLTKETVKVGIISNDGKAP